jgi:hypothetical protein
MRAHHLLSLLCLSSACGGNWSNRDLEFVNALPRPAELRSKLPDTAQNKEPLSGVSTRRDGLQVGDPSKSYQDARRAQRDFNNLIDYCLNVIETVRKLAPTQRTSDSRIWGPYPDEKNPGYEIQIGIRQRSADTFSWAVQVRPKGGEFFDVLTGDYQATDSVKRGRGTLALHLAQVRGKLKLDDGLEAIDEITVGYISDTFPKRVEMLFTFAPGNASGLSQIGYTYREQADGSGAMRFLQRSTSTDITALEIDAFWVPTGAGRVVGRVLEGTYAGAALAECWDTSFIVTYFTEAWAGGQSSGSASDCVAVAGF